MQMNTRKRLMTLTLCAIMVFLCCVPSFSAPEAAKNEGTANGKSEGLVELSDQFDLDTYDEYLEKYKDVPAGSDTIVIKSTDYDAENTTAKVTVEKNIYGKAGEVLGVPDVGAVSWTFDLEKAGMYSVKFNYAPMNDKKTNIERVFKINDNVPFSQARSIDFRKTWMFEYTEQEDGSLRFALDASGSEARPDSYCEFVWTEMAFTDSDTYYQDPFTFYFKEGKNTITLEGSRDELYLGDIILYTAEALPSYEDVVKEYAEKNYTHGNAVIEIECELPVAVSNYTIYPDYDRSSAISQPQDPIKIMRNVVGGDNWQTTGEWVRYNFNVPEGGAGLYSIVLRFKQDISDGVFTSRTVKIDGKIPFKEAMNCRFHYNSDWQVTPLTNDTYQFSFYLDEGDHTIDLMATLGDFGPILARVKEVSTTLNDYYLQIMKLTGSQPDPYRDYGFARIMPEVVSGFSVQAEELRAVIDYISSLTDSHTSSNAILENMITVLEKLASDEAEIASNIGTFRDAISNMSSWVADYEIQPLLVDHITIQSAQAELPRATASMMESLKYEFAQFIGSFYADYNTLSSQSSEDEEAKYEETIECWTSSGRDQAQIIRNLTDANFCRQYGIGVSIRLIDGSALLPSILAGVGPDVSLDPTSPIDYALRGACMSFNGFSDFEEVIKRFTPSSLQPLSLFGETYAIPYGQAYSMMFVRTDILADLKLEVPKTWDDILEMVPVLKYNNMDVGIPNDYKLILYQNGGNIWDETSENVLEHGWRTTFEQNETLSAFQTMCDMFTQYSLPVAFDVNTRFKDGSMPVIITDSSFYTSITLFAPEISGLWEMTPLPGTVDKDGNINNTGITTSTGIMILKGCSDIDLAWTFIKWYTDKDFQIDYSSELVALLGESAKSISANVAAMKEMPWNTKELAALLEQGENLVGIPAYPGTYIIDRYTSFAFSNAYNNGADPVNSLLGYVNAINAEISRKRKEFELPLEPESQTVNEE